MMPLPELFDTVLPLMVSVPPLVCSVGLGYWM